MESGDQVEFPGFVNIVAFRPLRLGLESSNHQSLSRFGNLADYSSLPKIAYIAVLRKQKGKDYRQAHFDTSVPYYCR